MSTTHDSLVGDIIELEHTDDYTATTVSWTKVGRTGDSIEVAPNTETASKRHHDSKQLDKAAVSEAWEVSFSRDVTVTTGGLEALGLLDTSDSRKQGSHDTRRSDAVAEAVQITVYEDETARSNDNVKYQLGIDEYVIVGDSDEINVEDFSTMSLIIHSLTQPIRLDQGGTLGG